MRALPLLLAVAGAGVVAAAPALRAAPAAPSALRDFPAPVYTIDLATPPRQRWAPVVAGVVAAHGWDASFGALLGWVHSLVPEAVIKDLSPVFDTLLGHMGPYGEEVQGVWDALQVAHPGVSANFTLGTIVAMNFIYDLSAFCTSIVAEHSNGTMYHGRNLDYPLPGLNYMTATVHFVNSSSGSAAPVYTGTAFTGYVGLLTGMRPGGFSVSINQRSVNASQPLAQFLDNIAAALHGGQSVGFFVRDTLASARDFGSAVATFNATPMIAPMYITVAGTAAGQGAVITRNRDHADDSHGAAQGVWALASAPASWFRLETNYDHWAPAGDGRRAAAYAGMNALSPRDVDGAALMGVLSTPPVLNGHTQYTTLMSAATGEFFTLTRAGTAPGKLVRGPAGWAVRMEE